MESTSRVVQKEQTYEIGRQPSLKDDYTESIGTLRNKPKKEKEKRELFGHTRSTPYYLDKIIQSQKSKCILSQNYSLKAQKGDYSGMTIDLKRRSDIVYIMPIPDKPEEREFYNSLTKQEQKRYDTFSPKEKKMYRQFEANLKSIDERTKDIVKTLKECNDLL